MRKWIKVSEQLPEEGDIVDCYNVRTKVVYPEMCYDEEQKKWFDDNGVENAEYDEPPTHWIERDYLPPFPTEE